MARFIPPDPGPFDFTCTPFYYEWQIRCESIHTYPNRLVWEVYVDNDDKLTHQTDIDETMGGPSFLNKSRMKLPYSVVLKVYEYNQWRSRMIGKPLIKHYSSEGVLIERQDS